MMFTSIVQDQEEKGEFLWLMWARVKDDYQQNTIDIFFQSRSLFPFLLYKSQKFKSYFRDRHW